MQWWDGRLRKGVMMNNILINIYPCRFVVTYMKKKLIPQNFEIGISSMFLNSCCHGYTDTH